MSCTHGNVVDECDQCREVARKRSELATVVQRRAEVRKVTGRNGEGETPQDS
jgi:hypothetical protein